MKAGALALLCACVLVAQEELERGLALARQGRWEEAAGVLRRGQALHPENKSFPIELAGVAWRQQRPDEARELLQQALRLDPHDTYANRFLATVFFRAGNLEAALKYWNRAGEPRIERIRTEPPPEIDPVLLDRAFAFGPSQVLALSAWRATQARLELLDAFRWRMDLEAHGDRGFDTVLRPFESGGAWWMRALGMLRGAAYQTLTPEFHNLAERGWNLDSLLRWDAQKRRVRAAFSAPWRRDPAWRWSIYGDWRREIWNSGRDFRFEKSAAGIEFAHAAGDEWVWASGTEAAFRPDGQSVKYFGRAERRLWALPERNLRTAAWARGDFGRVFGEGGGGFAKLESGLRLRWEPGRDYRLLAQCRAGQGWGSLPLDELYVLGLDRDSELWLRGLPATRHGKKGAGLLGRRYFLTNLEFDRVVWQPPLARLSVGPFLDSGQAGGPPAGFGKGPWSWSAGLQARLRVADRVELRLSYGRELRGGEHAVFFSSD